MGSKCSRGVATNVREELWSYFALSGLLFLNVGIVLMVFAVKEATKHPIVLHVFGSGLILLGVLATITSWYVHRQQRQKKTMCLCLVGCCTRGTCCMCCNETRVRAPRKIRVAEAESHSTKTYGSGGRSSAPDHTIKMFSTPEFQKYAEFVKRDTAGVEPDGGRRNFKRIKVEPQDHKQPTNALGPREVTQPSAAGGFSNPQYVHTGHTVSMASPILLNLSRKP